VDRRNFIKASAAFTVGAASVSGGEAAVGMLTGSEPLPLYTGPAAAIHQDRSTAPKRNLVNIHYGVDTNRKLVALTFDDGPMPKWTPEVLDILDAHRTPATFFMVGRNALAHRDLIHGRLDRHEVGNHTWEHRDLAKADYSGARQAIERGHQALVTATGREPVLLRPPFGHLAGSTVLAAADLGYTIVLWNLQMLESNYTARPAGLVDYVVEKTTPGTILLAHDTGNDDRLVAIRDLPQMIVGLRRRGFEFVTVSQLLAAANG
jgi:peptidoglycan/xylan/chitin deacetylase (PgdA/CDA1 family)